MNPTLSSILTFVVALVSGAGLSQLLTIGAQRRRITGEGSVAEANAAKTYHEMSMEIFREVRLEADKLQGKVTQLTGEVETLRVQIHSMSVQMDEKDRIIASYRRGGEA
jgi:TolA-binding protein